MQPIRILLDCSHAIRCSGTTGVQRVVWNVLREAIAIDSRCQATVYQANSFLPFEGCNPPPSQKLRSNVLDSMPSIYKLFAKVLCAALPWHSVRKGLLPEPGRLGLLRSYVKRLEKQEKRSRQSVASWSGPGVGDLLLLPDAYWGLPGIWSGVAAAKKKGAVVATVLYDLIPMTHPQFVPSTASASFREYFRCVVNHSDMIVAISETVRDQCREEIDRNWQGIIPAERIQAFRLGADIQTTEGRVSDTIATLFSPQAEQTPYLMVSTFDPRKNHTCLLDAFELLWRSHPEASLCLVGGRGWMSEDLLRRIESHPRYGKQIHKFHALSDVDVQYCYQNARGVLCPSFVEGFGLPIVEGLAFGRKTIVADTAIHHEVGRGACDYFDPNLPSELTACLANWERQISAGASLHRSCVSTTTWRQATREVLHRCDMLYDACSEQEFRIEVPTNAA